MKKLLLVSLILFFSQPLLATTQEKHIQIDNQALTILKHMSLREKIGQKLMLDFRYWCTTKPTTKTCTNDFTSMNPDVAKIISQYHIGGVILFANNLKDIAQITTLTYAFQHEMIESNNLPVLIGTDQEGGIVVRLPRDASVTFAGNMALAAAYLAHPEYQYTQKVASVIANGLQAVGINIDFAPDIDVNVNPLNPVINVRSFSDDPKLVANLGGIFTDALQTQGIAATLKHFPGHGDTTTDSHLGLPIVNHNSEQAWSIDLYPFKDIIAKYSPDLIMTAHIQFPALDNSKIYSTKLNNSITTPATLSRTIQSDLLRMQLGFTGVSITDALDMGAISQNFDAIDATIKSFQAGVDIALMPIELSQPEDTWNLENLFSNIESAVISGNISEQELDESVLRIIKLKIKLGILENDQTSLQDKITHAEQLFSDKKQYELEENSTNDAITLVQNNKQLLPIKNVSSRTSIYILTPWLEQGMGIAMQIGQLQQQGKLPKDMKISYKRMSDTNLDAEKAAIRNADIVIVGNITTKVSPVTTIQLSTSLTNLYYVHESLVFPEIPAGDNLSTNLLSASRINQGSDAQFAYQALAYAKSKNKKTIFISLLAPYDLPNYKDVSDVMLAGYDFYGYLAVGNKGYYRGPSMAALTRIIFGIAHAGGKLPIDIPNPDNVNEMVYARGYGLTT